MAARLQRQTVSLEDYPDLVAIYLGMRVNALQGLKTLFGFGPKIEKSAAEQPDGLLSHEVFLWSLFPPHAGIRQYWRDFESLERWSRSEPHRQWWQSFVKDPKGTGFWHEAYSIKGGFEAIYVNLPQPAGMLRFAPESSPHGSMYSSRKRLQRGENETLSAPVSESDLAGPA
jgi:hypothetical protein